MANRKNRFPLVQTISTILLIATGILAVIMGVRTIISISNITSSAQQGIREMSKISVLVPYRSSNATTDYMTGFYIASLVLYIATAVFCVAGPIRTRLKKFQIRWNVLAVVTLISQIIIILIDMGIHKSNMGFRFSMLSFYFYLALIYAVLSLFPLLFGSKYSAEEEEEEEEPEVVKKAPVIEYVRPATETLVTTKYVYTTTSGTINQIPGTEYKKYQVEESRVRNAEEINEPVINAADYTVEEILKFKSGMLIDIAPLDRANLCYLRHNNRIDAEDFSNGVDHHYKKKPYIVRLN